MYDFIDTCSFSGHLYVLQWRQWVQWGVWHGAARGLRVSDHADHAHIQAGAPLHRAPGQSFSQPQAGLVFKLAHHSTGLQDSHFLNHRQDWYSSWPATPLGSRSAMFWAMVTGQLSVRGGEGRELLWSFYSKLKINKFFNEIILQYILVHYF